MPVIYVFLIKSLTARCTAPAPNCSLVKSLVQCKMAPTTFSRRCLTKIAQNAHNHFFGSVRVDKLLIANETKIEEVILKRNHTEPQLVLYS